MKKKATTRWTALPLAITLLLFGLSLHTKAQDSTEKAQNNIAPYYTSHIFIGTVFLHDTNPTIKLKARLKPDSFSAKTIATKDYASIKNMIAAKKPASFEQRYYGPDFMFIYEVATALFSGCH